MRLVVAEVVALVGRMFLLMLFVLVRPKEETSTKRGDPTPSHHTPEPSKTVDLTSKNEAQLLRLLLSFLFPDLLLFSVHTVLYSHQSSLTAGVTIRHAPRSKS